MKKPPIIWLNVAFFTITFITAITLVPWYGFEVGYDANLWIAFIACMFYSGMSITAGYHRLWAHKAYQAHPILEVIYALGGAFSVQNSALHWSSDHRLHHGKVDDIEHDPYAATRGFWFSHIGWMLREHQGDTYSNYNNVRDLQKNKIVMWQHKNYLLLTIATNLLIPLCIGIVTGDFIAALLLCGLLRLVLSQHFTFFINSLAHIWGTRPYTETNTARDNGFLALLTYGEGYHNFHHIFASDYRNGIQWWHYDPTKWMIKSFSYVGLTSNLKVTPDERIEKAKATTLFAKTKSCLANSANMQEQMDRLQTEYDVLINKLQHYYKVRKRLIEMQKQKMLKQCERSALMQQYTELKEAWQIQNQVWLKFNESVLKLPAN